MRTGIHWFNDGVWKDHFIPTQNQVNSDLLAKGNAFQSGNLAMTEIHTWYSCCVNPAAPAKPIVGDNFGWAVAPSYNGETTAKLHADTFSMLKTTKHPDEAFAVLSALAASGDLATIYGAMPADPAQQQAFMDAVNEAYPKAKLDWAVPAGRCSSTRTSPTTRPGSPTTPRAKAAWQAFWIKYRTTPERRHRRRARHPEDHPPGHLRRGAGQEPLATPPPAASRVGCPDHPGGRSSPTHPKRDHGARTHR